MARKDAIETDYVVIGEEEARSRFGANRERVLAEFWPKLRRVARRLPFVEDVVAAYYCMIDARTPLHVRAMLAAALAYFVMPIDVIPDVILGLGLIDDIAVLGAVIGRFAREIRPEHRAAARRALGG